MLPCLKDISLQLLPCLHWRICRDSKQSVVAVLLLQFEKMDRNYFCLKDANTTMLTRALFTAKTLSKGSALTPLTRSLFTSRKVQSAVDPHSLVETKTRNEITQQDMLVPASSMKPLSDSFAVVSVGGKQVIIFINFGICLVLLIKYWYPLKIIYLH